MYLVDILNMLKKCLPVILLNTDIAIRTHPNITPCVFERPQENLLNKWGSDPLINSFKKD